MSDKKITVNEFKNWLSGVTDFQPEDWSPDLNQWKKILAKIEELDDVQPVVPKATTVLEAEPIAVAAVAQTNEPPVTNPENKKKSPIVHLDDDEGVDLPPIKKVERQVEVHRNSKPSVIEENGRKIIDTGTVHKVKNIDTSDGNYQSTFV